jgi:5-formyltetrahydrofolate cyclo-ligase
LLAGNIVQVRLERKALSAAVSPTCCSGREQRSKTAHAGSAIPMKIELRKQLRAARRRIPAAEHRRRSQLAAKNVARLPGFASGKRVAVYLPFDRETDTAWLLREARRRGVQLFVPVVVDRRRCRMRFHALVGPLKRGIYGIQIPHRSKSALSARWLNLVVVPLVGIDAAGCRLGMGAGYYDRALAFRRVQRHRFGPHLVGLAFEVQRTQETFAEPWDIRLDSLATESGLHSLLDQEGAT